MNTLEERDELLTEKQTAKRLNVAEGTLRWWRHQNQGVGPKWFRMGPKAIRYRSADVEAWLAEQYRQGSETA